MKIKVTEEIAGKVVVTDTIIKLNVNPFDSEGSKVPLAIFEHKGDILVADAVASPKIVEVGNDGQVLVADSSESTGVKWKTMQLGTITLVNSEATAIPSGTVVTNGVVSGTFRIATSADTTNLFVTSENISAGEDGVLYAVSGISCNVRVTAGAIAIGDSLKVSSTNGVAEYSSVAGFATAVTSKSAGAAGTVTCVLVNTIVSTLTVPQGGLGRVSLTENALLAGDGTDPVKMIASSAGYLHSSGSGALPAYQAVFLEADVTIATTDWDANNLAAKTVSGVLAGAASKVWDSVADASYSMYSLSDVRLYSNAANTVTWKCTVKPTSSITVKVIWSV